ncbi:MAG TPA: DoxX family membrane protein [Bacteroidales bacterium]|nr:DoxX family membrane protein [Bacteroidales bacterium]
MSQYLQKDYSLTQLTILVILRILIGWHFLYEGVSKLANPDWSSAGFLLDSRGLFSVFINSLASNPDLLKAVDFLNVWGLVVIGLGLLLGCFTRISVIAGIILLGFYYLSHPPMIGFKFSVPSEGSYLWVNKNLIELFALAVLLVFPTGRIIGIDRFIFRK